MRYFIVKLLLIVTLLAFNSNLDAQINCARYHTQKCRSLKSQKYTFSSQSRTVELNMSHKTIFNISVFGGYDYHFAICFEKYLFEVEFKIYEDNEAKTLIFDNTQSDFAKEVTLTMKVAKPLIIEIKLPRDSYDLTKYSPKSCIGVLIEYRKTLVTGFR